jgi:excisionase family DNA binding protein
MAELRRYYTTKTAADYLGTSQARVRDLCENGKLKHFRRRDGGIRISGWALEEFKAGISPEHVALRTGQRRTRAKISRKSIGREQASKPERVAIGKAARIAGMSTYLLRKHAKLGEVPGAYQIVEGGAWRFELRRLRQWVRRLEKERQKAETTPTFETGRVTPESRSDADIDLAYERLFAPKRSRAPSRASKKRDRH